MWKIKYPEIKQKTNQFFTDKEIDNACAKQMHDGTDQILLSKGLAKKSNSTSNIEITIPKNEFEIVYNPNDWNPFPCVRPPECGEYLVPCTVIDGQTVWLDEIKTYRVFQVLPDGNALAFECDSEYDKYCYGDVALLAKREKPFYDGIKVNIPKPTIEGTYRYETRNNFIKTVPIVH